MNRILAKLIVPALALLMAQGVATAQQPDMQYVTWQDATNTYQFDVPAGWRADATAVDVLGEPVPSIFLFAPGDTAVAILSIPGTEMFIDPDPSLGLAEGSIIEIGQYAVTVRAFQQPGAFLENYLRTDLLSQTCARLTVTASESYGDGPLAQAADLAIDCVYPEGRATGFFSLSTTASEIPGTGTFWMPEQFLGFLAEPGYEWQAQQALIRLAQSLAPAGVSAYPGHEQEYVVIPGGAPQNQPVAQPNAGSSSSTYSDPYLQAQQELYNQQLTASMMSNMLQMQHETNMMIINNIGGGDYTYEYQWTWTYDD